MLPWCKQTHCSGRGEPWSLGFLPPSCAPRTHQLMATRQPFEWRQTLHILHAQFEHLFVLKPLGRGWLLNSSWGTIKKGRIQVYQHTLDWSPKGQVSALCFSKSINSFLGNQEPEMFVLALSHFDCRGRGFQESKFLWHCWLSRVDWGHSWKAAILMWRCSPSNVFCFTFLISAISGIGGSESLS